VLRFDGYRVFLGCKKWEMNGFEAWNIENVHGLNWIEWIKKHYESIVELIELNEDFD